MSAPTAKKARTTQDLEAGSHAVTSAPNGPKLVALLDCSRDVFFEVSAVLLRRRVVNPGNRVQIVRQLEPVDLLQLCRVSKAFRAVLLDKPAHTLWVAARKNVDGAPVPDPPPHLSEPKLACLLFESHCLVSTLRSLFRNKIRHRLELWCGCQCKGKLLLRIRSSAVP